MITTEELTKSIVKWIVRNAERESIFLTPEPEWAVNSHDLTEHIELVTGISHEQVGEWITDENDKKESEEQKG